MVLTHRDNVFMEINRTICWLQISFKKIPKGLFTPCIHITAIEPDIKIIKPTFCSHNNSKTFIQPKLSLNFTVGAHLLSPFSGSLWLWLKLVTNNKQQFPCLVGIAHPHMLRLFVLKTPNGWIYYLFSHTCPIIQCHWLDNSVVSPVCWPQSA